MSTLTATPGSEKAGGKFDQLTYVIRNIRQHHLCNLRLGALISTFQAVWHRVACHNYFRGIKFLG